MEITFQQRSVDHRKMETEAIRRNMPANKKFIAQILYEVQCMIEEGIVNANELGGASPERLCEIADENCK